MEDDLKKEAGYELNLFSNIFVDLFQKSPKNFEKYGRQPQRKKLEIS